MLEIIDCQIHEPISWLPVDGESTNATLHDLLPTELALASMDAVGVDAAMIHSRRPEWNSFAANRFPDRFVSKVWLNHMSATLDGEIALLRQRPGVLGIRVSGFGPNAERIQPLQEGAFDRLFASAEKHQVPVSIYLPGHLPLAGQIAAKYPQLPLLIEHVGIQQPMVLNDGKADTPRFARLPELLRLADHDNIWLALSAVCTLSLEPYPFDDLWPPLLRILDAFGPRRLLWGSDIQRVQGRWAAGVFDLDYPGKHTYAESVAFFRDATELTVDEKQLILGANFRCFYRWPARSLGSG